MTEYISKEVARRIIDSGRTKWQMLAVLDSAVPADVRENVHGEWKRNFNGNEFYWFCTNCKIEYYEEDLWMGGNEFPNFCPNCGADMRGEEE